MSEKWFEFDATLDEGTGHVSEADVVSCPFCRGLVYPVGRRYMVTHVLNGHVRAIHFSDPCRAWSFFDFMRNSWTDIHLSVVMLGGDDGQVHCPVWALQLR